MSDLIEVNVDQRSSGKVATITITNETMRNALPAEGRLALAQTFTAISQDPELRLIILTGAGNQSFIGGADISQMSRFPNSDTAQQASYNTLLACDAIRHAPVPVIARINGYCLGAGMILAASCDLRVGATNLRCGMPEVRYGIPSAMQTCLLPRLIGWGKAMELVYTAEMMDAEEAYRTGFLQRLVSPDALDDAVEQWVTAILKAGKTAIRLQKELNRDWERMSLNDAVQQGVRAIGLAHDSGEPRQMMTAFLEQRRALKAGKEKTA